MVIQELVIFSIEINDTKSFLNLATIIDMENYINSHLLINKKLEDAEELNITEVEIKLYDLP